MSDILMPKGPARMQGPKDAVMERLRRRITGYRKHHDDCGPRFEHTINGLNDQQRQETLALRQRFLESKAKKSAKKSDKNKTDGGSGGGSGNSGTQKLQKRQCEDVTDGGSGGGSGVEYYEPPTKISICNNKILGSPSKSTLKHLQPPGNSSASVKSNKSANSGGNMGSESGDKYGILSPADAGKNTAKSGISGVSASSGTSSNPSSNIKVNTNPGNGSGHVGSPLVDHYSMGNNGPSSNSSNYSTAHTPNPVDFKNERNNPAFVDLDQCAAALEKDAAENGSLMSGLIGVSDYDTLKDLISEISDNPDFNFDDFDDDHSEIKSSLSFPESSNNMNPGSSVNHSVHNEDSGPFSAHNRSGTPPVAPVTPASISSPRVSHVKMESDSSMSSGGHCIDNSSGGNRGLSHCTGPSPTAASTASPLACQLNSHPSQTPPYSSSSAFDSASPSGAQLHTNPLTPGSSKNYGGNKNSAPNSNSGPGSNNPKGTRIPYTSPGNLAMESPAAQTLKHMAEQHQHKAQLGMSTFQSNPNSNSSPARSPFNGDAYGNFTGNCEFNGSGPSSSTNSNNLPTYPNVPPRNQTSGVPNETMVMNMPIKQENIMYSSQSNIPSAEMKRNAPIPNHPHQSQQHQQPLTPPQSQQQHKMSPGNAQRLPTPTMMQSNHPAPAYSNKSFMQGTGASTGVNMNAASGGGSNAMPSYLNRPTNHMGMNTGPPNGYPPTSNHSGYQGNLSHPPQNHNQQTAMSQHNPANAMHNAPQGPPPGNGGNDMKNQGNMRPQSYYYNQGPNPGHHPQMHMQQQSQHQNVPEQANFMHSNPSQPQGNMSTNAHGQTINFTQQHLKMSPSGPIPNPQMMNMNRMGGPVIGPPGMPNTGGMPRLPMGDMNNMNSRVEMQQRMMRNQLGRNQPMQQQVPGMRQHSQEAMSQQQQMHPGVGPMNRFPKVGTNALPNGPGRPNAGPPNTMIPNQPNESTNPSMQNTRMPQNAFAGHGMPPMMPNNSNQMSINSNHCMNGGGNVSLPMAPGMKPNNMNMPMRRMPFNSAQGMPLQNPNQGIHNRPAMSTMNPAMSMSNHNQQQAMGSSQDWMAMSDPNSRSYLNQNPQQGLRPPLRPSSNPGGYHPGMGMPPQPSQPHHLMGSHREVPNAGVTGPMQMTGNQPGLTGNPMSAMSYNNQPHHGSLPMGPNLGNYSQSPVNKLPPNQMNMCSSDFQMKNETSTSNGSGNGALICANSQPSMNHQMNSIKSNNSDATNQDFNMYLLDNMASNNDASSFNEEPDFLSSFDTNSNYQQILDSL